MMGRWWRQRRRKGSFESVRDNVLRWRPTAQQLSAKNALALRGYFSHTMSRKWVDNEVYFGPNRRTRGLGKRWGDRRSHDDSEEPPTLSAVLRRLRVHLSNSTTSEDRRRLYDMAKFAAAEAEHHRLPECARPLREALTLIKTGDYAAADRLVMQAQAAFNTPD